MSITFVDVEVSGVRTSVRVADGLVAAISSDLRPAPDDLTIDGDGGALIPGLHDHHIHLAALAAADRSVRLDGQNLDAAIAEAHRRVPLGEWLRAVGYDEYQHGPLDGARLDAVAPGRPVRVQHRSGALWVLSPAARRRVGAPTDCLFGQDDWLRERLPPDPPPAIGRVARRLASFGITGVTDATPSTSIDAVRLLAEPGLAVRVTAMGGSVLAGTAFPIGVDRGPVKVVIGDHDLPALIEITAAIATAHEAGRTVAIHCVTRVALVLAVAAWDEVGAAAGDRIEHGAVVPPDLAAAVARLGLSVVTQPAFIAARGDQYVTEVDAEDRPHLYPCASLLALGVPVGGSTDAPFGPEDPWTAIAAAIDRRTSAGRVLSPDERVSPRRGLDLFLSPADAPGAPARRVSVGERADLCLLDADLEAVLRDPDARHVRATVCRGQLTFDRANSTQ